MLVLRHLRELHVRGLGTGRSTLTFDNRVVARGKGYETIRLADRTKEMKTNATEALERKISKAK